MRPVRRVVYMSHQLSGNFAENLLNAGLWYRFLRSLSAKGVIKLLGGKPDKVSVPFDKKAGTHVVYTTTGSASNLLVRPFDEPPVIIAPWLTCTVADGRYPGGRLRAIDDAIRVVSLADENWQVGAHISPGMVDEANHSRLVRDLTTWGEKPPIWEDGELFVK